MPFTNRLWRHHLPNSPDTICWTLFRYTWPSFPEMSGLHNPSKIPKNDSQEIIFVMISCVALREFSLGDFGMYGVLPFRWEKGSETPSCDGKKGLRLPRSLCRSMRNEGVSDPFSHRKRESQTLFPTAKGKTPHIPKSP